MKKKARTIYRFSMAAFLSLVLAAGLVLPLQTDTVSGASSLPKISGKKQVSAAMVPVKKKMDGKKFTLNLRLEAGQDLFGYDTLQGSCAGGGYCYYILHNRSEKRSKVVKMKISNWRVVKISSPLKLYHANDMTYNGRLKKLVVAHGRGDQTGLSVINPKTLKLQTRKHVRMPENLKSLPGAAQSQGKIRSMGYSGFNNIAYNSKHRQYVVQLYRLRDFLYLNESFKPVRYVRLHKRDSQIYQGMDSFGNYSIVCNSFSSGKPYNILSVYDWSGNYISRVTLNRGIELESLFHYKNKLYAGFYYCYLDKYVWTSRAVPRIKKVRVAQKVLIKSGKNKGKYKTVYKTKRKLVTERKYIKVKKDRLWTNRDNYLYRITKL